MTFLLARGGLALALTLTLLASSAMADSPFAALKARWLDPAGGVMVVAHRGCHNASPQDGLSPVPENSLDAVHQCLQLGVDMVEIDVRRSRDGALVIIHDATVDRTTDGSGKVRDLTLAELKRLRLRLNFGGAMSPTLTDARVLTLDELLAATRGRILVNLDVKEDIYAEVIAAVARAGMTDEVVVKAVAEPDAPPLADQAPYRDAMFMPIVGRMKGAGDLDAGAVARRQLGGRRRVPAVETVYLDRSQFDQVRAAAEVAHARLWINTLTGVGVLSVISLGGDADGLRDGETWRTLIAAGANVIQTDEPGPLLRWLGRARR